jgi:hypothetical protein
MVPYGKALDGGGEVASQVEVGTRVLFHSTKYQQQQQKRAGQCKGKPARLGVGVGEDRALASSGPWRVASAVAVASAVRDRHVSAEAAAQTAEATEPER